MLAFGHQRGTYCDAHSFVMVFDVITKEGHTITPHSLPQGLEFNSSAFIKVLVSVVRVLMGGGYLKTSRL